MAKSKKFKPVLKASEIRCGVAYLRITLTDEGVVYCSVYTPTKDPYTGPSPFKETGKTLMVDYICQSIGHDAYRTENNFVSDMTGIYYGRRQTNSFRDYLGGRKIVLHSKGLFKFSNKLLEKINSFENDPIKVYEFLNPERFFTASERFAIATDIKERKFQDLQKYSIKENIYEFFNNQNHSKLISEEKPYELNKIKKILPDYKYYKL